MKNIKLYLIAFVIAGLLFLVIDFRPYDKEYLEEQKVFNERMAKFLNSSDETIPAASLVTHDYEYVCMNYDYEKGIYGAKHFMPNDDWYFKTYNDIYFDENEDGLIYIDIGRSVLNTYLVQGTTGDLSLIGTKSNVAKMCFPFKEALIVKSIFTKNYIYTPSTNNEVKK
jgi:hypothetical protein